MMEGLNLELRRRIHEPREAEQLHPHRGFVVQHGRPDELAGDQQTDDPEAVEPRRDHEPIQCIRGRVELAMFVDVTLA